MRRLVDEGWDVSGGGFIAPGTACSGLAGLDCFVRAECDTTCLLIYVCQYFVSLLEDALELSRGDLPGCVGEASCGLVILVVLSVLRVFIAEVFASILPRPLPRTPALPRPTPSTPAFPRSPPLFSASLRPSLLPHSPAFPHSPSPSSALSRLHSPNLALPRSSPFSPALLRLPPPSLLLALYHSIA